MPELAFAIEADSDQVKTQLGATQSAADVDDVARSRAGASDGPAGSDFAEHSDADRNGAGLRRVPASEAKTEGTRRSAQPTEKTVEPSPGPASWQGERQEKEAGSCAHGGKIACGPRKRFVADGIWRMPIAEKMDTLNERVTAQDPFGVSTPYDDGRVVADPESQTTLA